MEEIQKDGKSNITQLGKQVETTSAEMLASKARQIQDQADLLVTDRPTGILALLDSRERERRIGEIALIKGELEARKEILTLYKDAQISATKEHLENFLIKLRVGSRADLLQFVMKQLEFVRYEADRITGSIEESMTAEWNRVQALTVPSMRERRLKDFDVNMNKNYDLIDKLFDDFRSAAYEQIGEKSK